MEVWLCFVCEVCEVHVEVGAVVGVSWLSDQVSSVRVSMERVAGGAGSLLSLTTSATVRVSKEGLFSFSPAAALRASANEMFFSAFIRCNFFSKIHL